MTPKFESALQNLAEAGLNIFASTPIKSLPPEILKDIELEGIDVSRAATIVILGNGGGTLWSKLSKPIDPAQHPFDQYTQRQILNFNDQYLHDTELQLLYPHPKWTIPLQRLGRLLNIARPSKLGLDIHPNFGPWFAYRGAFLTSVELPPTNMRSNLNDVESPCESCATTPCISHCPSGAVQKDKFQLSTCSDFRLSESSPCFDRCLARMACPVGREHQYSLEQFQYHMLRPAHLKRLALYGTKK